MPNFIINKYAQPNGEHEVHNASIGCSNMPARENQVDLGSHATSQSAVVYIQQQWPTKRINGCYYCCYACHTKSAMKTMSVSPR